MDKVDKDAEPKVFIFSSGTKNLFTNYSAGSLSGSERKRNQKTIKKNKQKEQKKKNPGKRQRKTPQWLCSSSASVRPSSLNQETTEEEEEEEEQSVLQNKVGIQKKKK